ncbi:hypothetical protein K491DRAFT_728552 [Lophiostoma macrostomum CBS 122681]|uniref:Uncharacterized protein n=1 Tax=Lophiostoma macrostomum CBS 122681 TaxID=1314788 RepID=A0A6A6TN89_9PLEO|nr:hypothetical protein K491DRAFT_728552 [Lophiostoma macrostomum CBS 122681]
MSLLIEGIDLSSVEKAVAGLLDQSQKLVGFPYEKNQNAAKDPSVVLDYNFAASGLVLRNITLQTAVQKAKERPAVAKLDPALTRQLESDGTGISFVTSASVWFHKESQGGLYLQNLQFDFTSAITWDITSTVRLQAVGLQVSVEYEIQKKAWKVVFDIGASLSIAEVSVDVSGSFVAADGTKLELDIVAVKRSSMVPEDLVGQLLGDEERQHYTNQFKLPPELTYPADGESSVHAQVTFARNATNWYFDGAKISLIWQLMAWRPFDQISFLVDSLQLDGLIRRAREPTPSESLYVYQGSMTGRIRLGGAKAEVAITYDSDTETVLAICTFPNSATISLQSIAQDQQLNSLSQSQRRLSTGHDLAGAAAPFPVPQGVPIDLDWCSSNFWSVNRVCSVEFSGTDMTKFSLQADYDLKWNITESIELTQVGIFFKVEKPLESQMQSTVAGYAYGSFLLDEKITLFLFVAGISDAECSQFTVSLSTSYGPNVKIGELPAQEILSSPKLIGDSVPTDGWLLPSSFPDKDGPKNALTSLEVFLGARMKQVKDPANSTGYSTFLESFTASLVLEGHWPILADLSLEKVSLSVVVRPSSLPPTAVPRTNYDIFTELSGTVGQTLTTVGTSNYEVTFTISINHAQDAANVFTASIYAVLKNHTQGIVDLGTIFRMPFSGLANTDIANTDSAKTIPDAFPAQPKDVLAIAALSLLITNPRSDNRQITFAAEATLTTGAEFNLRAAVIAVNPGNKDKAIRFTLTGGNIQKIMIDLLGHEFTKRLPTETVFEPGYSFHLEITYLKREGGPYTLIRVHLRLTSSVTWQLGPLAIKQLVLLANFNNLDTPDPSRNVSIEGVVAIAKLSIKTSATLTNTDWLSFKFIEAPPTTVVEIFVPGGLNSDGRLEAPDITADTGFGDYKTKPVSGLEVVFRWTAEGGWKASSLTLRLSSTKKWTLIDELLWVNDLTLSLMLEKMSSDNPKLWVQLNANFVWKNRNPPPDTKSLPAALIATRKDLTIGLSTKECTLPDFLYIATGGLWKPPDKLDFPLVTPQSLKLVLSWDDRTATIEISWSDWSVIKTLPKIASIKEPTLQAGLYKEKSGLSAKGEIKGTIVLLGVFIPISYELPNGPFRIFGFDVKKAYDMVRKIWNALKNIEDFGKRVKEVTQTIANILADLAAVADAMAEIAGIVVGALIELGVDAVIVSIAIAQAFGDIPIKPPTPLPGPEPDPSTNYPPSTPGSPYSILGGNALNAGEGSCYLIVYPKDGAGTGWLCTFQRPDTQRPTPTIVNYSGVPPLSASYISEVKVPPSSFSLDKSIVTFDSTPIVWISRNTLIFTPCDQYGGMLKGRYGRDGFLDPKRLTITVYNKNPRGSKPVYDKNKGFISRNNCLLLPILTNEAGTYTATISDHYSDTQRDFDFVVIDPQQCLVWGPGACSSKPEDIVEFWIKLRQGDGSDYFLPADSPLKINVLVGSGRGVHLITQLSYSTQAVGASYTAPVVGFTLDLSIGGVALAGGPIPMRARSSEAQVDASAASLKLWSMSDMIPPNLGSDEQIVIAQDDIVGGQIVLYERIDDNEYYRWRQAKPGVFKVQWPDNFGNPKLIEQLDGVYIIDAKAGKVGSESTLSVTAADSESVHCRGSPYPINIQSPRQLSQVVPYGTGLCSGYDEEGVICIKGYDQYGARWPVNIDSDCQITIIYKNKKIAWAADGRDDDRIVFQKPAKASEEFLVTIGPKITGLAFPEDVQQVSLADRSVPDPSRSYVQWKSLKKGAISVAKVRIVDQLGELRRQGGDDLVVRGVNAVPFSVTDNDDGTYTIRFILPDEAFPETQMAQVAGDSPQLSIKLGEAPILGSPFSFPLPDRQMIRARIVEDDYYLADKNEVQTFTVVCTDKNRVVTDLGLHSFHAFLSPINHNVDTFEPFINCTSETKDGQVLVRYKVPHGADAKYKLHVRVNDEEMQDKLAVVFVAPHAAVQPSGASVAHGIVTNGLV